MITDFGWISFIKLDVHKSLKNNFTGYEITSILNYEITVKLTMFIYANNSILQIELTIRLAQW